MKMPGVLQPAESWDPETEAILAREGRPYRPEMGKDQPEGANPYEQFKADPDKAQRLEADRSLTNRATQHFINSARGGTLGYLENLALTALRDPVAAAERYGSDVYRNLNPLARFFSDPLRADAERRLADAPESAEAQAYAEKLHYKDLQFAGLPPAEGLVENAVAVGGALAGGVPDPINWIPITRVSKLFGTANPLLNSIIDSATSNGLLNATMNGAMQEAEIAAGRREEFDPWEMGIQAGIGLLLGGPFGVFNGRKAEATYRAEQERALTEALLAAPEPGKAPLGPRRRPKEAEAIEPLPPSAPPPRPAETTPESLLEQVQGDYERLNAAQEQLFGEVRGLRNLDAGELARVEDFLASDFPSIDRPGIGSAEQPLAEKPPLTPGVKISQAAAPEKGIAGAETVQPIGRDYRVFDPDELKVDARRFQFKEGGDVAGVTGKLKGVKTWDPTKAGVTLIWQSKEGEFFIADGHQRHGLAKRLKAEGQEPKILGLVLREEDGITADDARVIAAAKNIAEGSGSALDAAKIFRARPEIAVNLPPASALVRDAQGLAKLSEDGFRLVVNKKVPETYAALVGKLAPDQATHVQLLDLVAQNEPANVVEAESMIRDALEAPAVQETTTDMFGPAEATVILFKERAQVLSAAASAIRKDRAAFATLVREEDRIAAAGNVLATSANQERALQDAAILQTLQTLARRKGPVGDALAQAAKALKDGTPRQTVVRDFLVAVRREADALGPGRGGRGAPGGEGEGLEPIAARAFHGTPHAFERFDLAKIGIGEGAQAYGFGLYFAGKREVAETYQASVFDTAKFDRINKRMAELAREMDLYRVPGTLRKFKDPRGEELAAEYDRLLAEKQAKGHLYEVDIKGQEEDFLDLDAPLSAQSRSVKEALQRLVGRTPKARFFTAEPEATLRRALEDMLRLDDGAMTTGTQLYHMIAGRLNPKDRRDGARQASQLLREAGIPGLRYLDERSRGSLEVPRWQAELKQARQKLLEVRKARNVKGKTTSTYEYLDSQVERWVREVERLDAVVEQATREKPTRNYVVFNDELINVLKRDDQPVDFAFATKPADMFETGADQKPQGVMPGMAQSQKLLLELRAKAPLRGKVAQDLTLDTGLFGTEKDQDVLFSLREDAQGLDFTPAATSKEAQLGPTSIVYAAHDEVLEVISIRTPVAARGNGSAKAAMQVFLERADAEGIPVRTVAQPLDRQTDPDGLRRFLNQLGFEETGEITPDGHPELVRWPVQENEAQLRRLIERNAPIAQIANHPLIVRSVQAMEGLPETHKQAGYNSQDWRASRKFEFEGEAIEGVPAFVERLVEFAESYAPRGQAKNEGRATIVIGPAAAGKSSYAEQLADSRSAAIIDADDAKRGIPEYRNGLGAHAVHEESSDLSAEVLSQLLDRRANVILPKIGANAAGIEKLVLALKGLDYHVDVINLKVSYETAFRRMIRRFLVSGRLVPPEYVKFVGEKPAETYRILREKGVADGYGEIDGETPLGEAAAVLDEAGGALQDVQGLRRDRGRRATEGDQRAAGEEEELEAIAARARPRPQNIPAARPQRGITGTRQPAERLEDLGTELAQTFGVPVRQGRLRPGPPGQKPIGQFDRKQGVIRLREMSDYDTRTHEVAHAMETLYGRALEAVKRAGALELEPMAYPGASARAKLSEGFAEWFRFYLTTPNYARRNAPAFTQAFEDFLNVEDPDRLAVIQDLQRRYFAWTRTPSQAVIAADVVSSRRRNSISEAVSRARKEGWGHAIGEWLDQGYTAFIDQAHPIKQLVDHLLLLYEQNHGRALDLKSAVDPYRLARMLPDGYSPGHIDAMQGVVPYHGQVSEGPGIGDALSIALGDTWLTWDDTLMADFAAYLISRRAIHEYARFHAGEIPNPPGKFTEGDYRVTIFELEQAHPEWAQAAQMIYEWNQNLLKKKWESGILPGGEATYLKLLERPDYVPMLRDMSDIDVAADQPGPRVLRDSILKAFRGSKRSVINPIESMLADAYETNALILRNDIVKALDDLAQMAGPGSGKFVERSPTQQLKGTTVSAEEVLRVAAKEAGLNPNDIDQLTTTVNALIGDDAKATIFRMGEINERGEPILYVWRNGQKQALRLADGEFGRTVYNTMTGLSQEGRNLFVSIMALPSTALRYGITTSPHFILANYLRDQVSAWVNAGNGFLPFISGARGVYDELAQTEITRIYNTYWGIMGGANVAALARGRGNRDVRALNKKGYAIKRFASWRGFAELTEIPETGTRLGVFRNAFNRAKREGLTDHEAAAEAAYQARDYIDFGRHGSHMLAARRLVTFLNASLQGLDKTVRTLTGEGSIRKAIAPYVNFRAGRPLSSRDKANISKAMSAWAKVTAIGLFGLGLSALYRDDPEYEEISDYLRATHWMVKEGSGKWWAIPKPFELGFISNLFERGFEATYDDNPVAMQKYLEGLWLVTAPPSEVPLVKTYFEIKHNEKDTGAPIVPEHLLGLDPQLQYTAWTSEFAKTVGAAVGVSPAVIDHAMQGIGGSWGKIIQDASIDRANEKGVAEIVAGSVSHRFLRDHTRGATSTRRFWEMISERAGVLSRTANTYQFMVENGAEGEGANYLQGRSDNEVAYALLEAHFEAADKRLHPMRRAKDAIAAISAVRRAIASNNLKTDTEEPDEAEPILLTGSARQQAQDILSRLEMAEARNALIVIGEPGWAQREIIDRDSLLTDLETALPQVHEELLARFDKAKVYDFATVRDEWPEVKNRLLTDRDEADFSDIVAAAK